MNTEVCCLPGVPEPVAVFKAFFVPVCKFRGTGGEAALLCAALVCAGAALSSCFLFVKAPSPPDSTNFQQRFDGQALVFPL